MQKTGSDFGTTSASGSSNLRPSPICPAEMLANAHIPASENMKWWILPGTQVARLGKSQKRICLLRLPGMLAYGQLACFARLSHLGSLM